jgi:hypothetical protein
MATKKIVADQNFECATTKNRDSARKIAPINHDISPAFLGGIQKVALVLTLSLLFLSSPECSFFILLGRCFDSSQ